MIDAILIIIDGKVYRIRPHNVDYVNNGDLSTIKWALKNLIKNKNETLATAFEEIKPEYLIEYGFTIEDLIQKESLK